LALGAARYRGTVEHQDVCGGGLAGILAACPIRVDIWAQGAGRHVGLTRKRRGRAGREWQVDGLVEVARDWLGRFDMGFTGAGHEASKSSDTASGMSILVHDAR